MLMFSLKCPLLSEARLCSRGRAVRCARAVRKVGHFPPPVTTGPRVLYSAPYSPCWYTRDFFLLV